MMALWYVLHTLAVVVWIGGMFFSFMVLRPAAQSLPPPMRLPLWHSALKLFFRWVGVAVAVLFVSGYLLIYRLGGFAEVGVYVHIMHGLAWVMLIIFKVIIFGPFRKLGVALEQEDLPAAGSAMGKIRNLVAFNLIIGALVIVVASGKFPL